ncbi:MAG: hypothetical protein IT289_11275 [Oligoflexia bacterium]|nr:hypothetical protein [Oligoflexia bacterium]
MKVLVLLVVLSSLAAVPAYGKKPYIDDAREKALETEVENLEIFEMEGTRDVSAEEARKQEALAREASAQLADTKGRKRDVQKRTQREIATSEGRRRTAEKLKKRFDTQTALLEKEIQKLEAEAQRIETRAQVAEDGANQAQLALETSRQKKQDMLKRKEVALETKAKFESQIRQLVADRKKVLTETAQIEKVTREIEKITELTGRQAERATVALEVAKDKRKNAQAMHDANTNELNKAKDDHAALEKELKKNLVATTELNEKVRKQRLEIEKRKAVINQQRNQLAIIKNRKQQAEIDFDEAHVQLRKIAPQGNRAPASKTF